MPVADISVKSSRKKAKKKSTVNGKCVAKTSDDSELMNLAAASAVGHILSAGELRSNDVAVSEDIKFEDMHLKEEVVAGLKSSGFYKPSPVQYKAIPVGKFGVDLIVQAKSGTGKTCVFSVLALEMIASSATTTQVLVLAPTREIAVQIASVMKSVGQHIKDLKVNTFIGGTTVEKPGVCHIAVGTPGRIHHMLSSGMLSGDNIRLLVLDEADQLLDSFTSIVQQIIASLTQSKQVICTSATYTSALSKLAERMMRSTIHISLGSEQLVAVTQYVHKLPYTGDTNQNFRAKLLHLKGILNSTMYNQVMIFTNSILKAETVTGTLRKSGMPVASLYGGQSQRERLKALNDLITHGCRILVATDLAARGIDSPHVSLVISLEPPPSPFTYLHRVGRAGRFGSTGTSVILASQGDDWLHVQAIATRLSLRLLVLPQPSLAKEDMAEMQVLPHLSPEQYEKWISTTSHRLTYSLMDDPNMKEIDPMGVWKMENKTLKVEDENRNESPVEVVESSKAVSNGNGIISDEKEETLSSHYDSGSLNNTAVLSPSTEQNGSCQKTLPNPLLDADYYKELNDVEKKLEDVLKVSLDKSCNPAQESKDVISISEQDINLTDAQEAICTNYFKLMADTRDEELKAADRLWGEGDHDTSSMLKDVVAGKDPLANLKERTKSSENKAIEKQIEEFEFHMKAIQVEKKLMHEDKKRVHESGLEKKNHCRKCKHGSESSSSSESSSCESDSRTDVSGSYDKSYRNNYANKHHGQYSEPCYNPATYYNWYGYAQYNGGQQYYQHQQYTEPRTSRPGAAEGSNKSKSKKQKAQNASASRDSSYSERSPLDPNSAGYAHPYYYGQEAYPYGYYPCYYDPYFTQYSAQRTMSRFMVMDTWVRSMARTSTLIARHQQQVLETVHNNAVEGLKNISSEATQSQYSGPPSSGECGGQTQPSTSSGSLSCQLLTNSST